MAIEHGDLLPTTHASGNRGIHGLAGFNAVADEAELAALAATCTAADHARVVTQTGGTAPGLYYYDGSAFKRLDPATAQAQITDLIAAQYSGFDRRQRYGRGGFALAAGSGTDTIPGPAAGFVRFLVALFPTADSGTAAMISIQLKPTDQYLLRPTSITDVTGGTLFQQPIAMAFGESFLCTNTGSGAGRVFYSYVDKPVANLTVVRVTANDPASPVTIVPVASAGTMNRLYALTEQLAGPNSIIAPKLCALIANDDTASNGVVLLLGPHRGRSGTLATALLTGPQFGLEEITDEPLRIAPRIAVSAPGPTARGFNVFACYETLPLP